MNCDLCLKRRACPFRVQVNLDDDSVLPIEELKGTVPVESLDLSRNDLGVASAIVIASLIGDNGALTQVLIFRSPCWISLFCSLTLALLCIVLQLDLSRNELCGVHEYGQGTFTAEGITAIADALCVMGALTQVLAF